jgi:hypothetical protein
MEWWQIVIHYMLKISNYEFRPMSFLAAILAFSFIYSRKYISEGDSWFWYLRCCNEDCGWDGREYRPDCLPTMYSMNVTNEALPLCCSIMWRFTLDFLFDHMLHVEHTQLGFFISMFLSPYVWWVVLQCATLCYSARIFNFLPWQKNNLILRFDLEVEKWKDAMQCILKSTYPYTTL